MLKAEEDEEAETLTVRAEASDGSNGTAVVTVTGAANDNGTDEPLVPEPNDTAVVFVPYEDLEAYLTNLTEETSADSPYTVGLEDVEINNDNDEEDVWAAVNNAVAGPKYEVLDLSDCTFADDTVSVA